MGVGLYMHRAEPYSFSFFFGQNEEMAPKKKEVVGKVDVDAVKVCGG